MRKLILFVGILTILVGCTWTIRALTTWRVNARAGEFNQDIENLFIGFQQYKEYLGTFPKGNNKEIVKAFQGNNEKKVIILLGRKQELSSQGEILDPWGTPLRFYFAGEGIMIRSAGPNKRFDDSTVVDADDYIRSTH